MEIGDLFYMGLSRNEEKSAYVVLNVNPLVNRLLACLKEPVELKIRDEIYKAIYNARGTIVLHSQEELDVLTLLRDGGYSKIVVKLADGRIVRTDVESEHGALTSEEFTRLLEESDFQTVSVTKQDGKVVRVSRTKPNVGRRRRPRQDPPEQRTSQGKR